MNSKYSLLSGVLLLFLLIQGYSCRELELFDGPAPDLVFSTDTLLFDTVFVSQGSVTKKITVRNREKNTVRIDRIFVESQADVQYDLIVDGQNSTLLQDVEILGDDSIIVFVRVTVSPNSTLNPFIIEDKLVLRSGETQRELPLVVWGQNAEFYTTNNVDSFLLTSGDTAVFRHFLIDQDTTLTANLPHVFFRSLVVRNGATLTIDPGVRIHMGSRASIFVHDGGSVRALGTSAQRIEISNKRLDFPYNVQPGEWGVFQICQDAAPSRLQHTTVRNATVGLYLGGTFIGETFDVNLTPELEANALLIANNSQHGCILQSGKASIDNSEFSDNGQSSVFAFIGGEYTLRHSSIINVSGGRDGSGLLLTNFTQLEDEDSTRFEKPLDFSLVNSIVEGNLRSEILWDRDPATPWEVSVEQSSLVLEEEERDTEDLTCDSCLYDLEISFETTGLDGRTFHIPDSASQSIGRADLFFSTAIPLDAKGNNRLQDGVPDLGAVERIE